MTASEFWFVLSFALIFAELFLGGTIVLLFSSLSALTIGFLITFALIDSVHQIHQILYFFLLTCIYSLLLWKPVKKIMKPKNLPEYSNIVGRECKIYGEDLIKGKSGKVEWSGSVFNAQIDENSMQEKFIKGDVVKIVSIKENIFYVSKGE